jgi:hypothetical protein
MQLRPPPARADLVAKWALARAQDLVDPPQLGVSAISHRYRGRLTARVGSLQSP